MKTLADFKRDAASGKIKLDRNIWLDGFQIQQSKM